MIAAKNDVSRYNNEMNAYLDCIKLEIDAATPKDPRSCPRTTRRRPTSRRRFWTRRTTPRSMSSKPVVGRFNEQLKIYKAKHTP